MVISALGKTWTTVIMIICFVVMGLGLLWTMIKRGSKVWLIIAWILSAGGGIGAGICLEGLIEYKSLNP